MARAYVGTQTATSSSRHGPDAVRGTVCSFHSFAGELGADQKVSLSTETDSPKMLNPHSLQVLPA